MYLAPIHPAITFSEKPVRTIENNDQIWEDYTVRGCVAGIPVGHLTITRNITPDISKIRIPYFWLNLSRSPPTPRPIVAYQGIFEDCQGRGLSGKLILLANEVCRDRFGETLSSDTKFAHNFSSNPKFHPRPAQRVWEKLEQDGSAYYVPTAHHKRWIMR